MEQLQTLDTLRGREVIRELFRELRFEKHIRGWALLSTLWRICTSERDIFRYGSLAVTVLHPLGKRSGTALWLQEVINRFYFSTVNSLVYFGAAILLVIVGLYRFTNIVGEKYVAAGIAFEASMLILMFIIMFFSPPDNMTETTTKEEELKAQAEHEAQNTTKEIVREIGEISSDYAAISSQLDEVITTLSALVARQSDLVTAVNKAVSVSSQAVSPQPELLTTMTETNHALQEFSGVVRELSKNAEQLKRAEIEQAVRREVEQLLLSKQQ